MTTKNLSDLESIILREIILEKARQRYIITGQTGNITEALKLYLENDAGPAEQIPLFITSPEIHKLEEILDKIRPTCEDCNNDLYLKFRSVDKSGRVYPTAWACKKCGLVEYSDKTREEWLGILRDASRKPSL